MRRLLYSLALLCSIGALVTGRTAAAQSTRTAKTLIEYGWDVPTPQQMQQQSAAMQSRPFDGIVFKLSGGFNAFVRKPIESASFASDEKILRSLDFKRYKKNFVLIWGTAEAGWDWYDDALWDTVVNNAKRLAYAGKAARLKGICFDPEPYDFNPWEYSKQAHASEHKFADYRLKVRQRGEQFMHALESEIPAPVLLTFFHVSLYGKLMDEKNLVQLERKLEGEHWGLMPDFLIGMLKGASKGARFVDGNEMSYYYTSSEAFFRAYHTIRERALNIIPTELRAKYSRQVQVGSALYVDHLYALREPKEAAKLANLLTPEERTKWFEHNAYYALYTTDEYVWCYSERMNWWTGPVPPGAEDALKDAVQKVAEGKPLGYAIEPILTEAATRQSARK